MKKILVALLALAFATSANAGFITGFVVGSVMNGGSSGGGGGAPQTSGPILVSADHDVITCRQYSPNRCVEGAWCPGPNCVGNPLPSQMAAFVGYKVIHRVGSVITPEGTVFIIMEVSK